MPAQRKKEPNNKEKWLLKPTPLWPVECITGWLSLPQPPPLPSSVTRALPRILKKKNKQKVDRKRELEKGKGNGCFKLI